jgi:hypothetical protein
MVMLSSGHASAHASADEEAAGRSRRIWPRHRLRTLKKRYVAHKVIYLLGTHDTNPDHPVLEELHGGGTGRRSLRPRSRLRGRDGRARRGDAQSFDLGRALRHAHNGNKMLTSPCGLAALFDLPGCAAER